MNDARQGARRNEAERRGDLILDIDRLPEELHSAAVDLGGIEDVVDQPEQAFAAGVNGVRSSRLIAARKRDLPRLAALVAPRASANWRVRCSLRRMPSCGSVSASPAVKPPPYDDVAARQR
jgi:hypothetical protein